MLTFCVICFPRVIIIFLIYDLYALIRVCIADVFQEVSGKNILTRLDLHVCETV